MDVAKTQGRMNELDWTILDSGYLHEIRVVPNTFVRQILNLAISSEEEWLAGRLSPRRIMQIDGQSAEILSRGSRNLLEGQQPEASAAMQRDASELLRQLDGILTDHTWGLTKAVSWLSSNAIRGTSATFNRKAVLEAAKDIMRICTHGMHVEDYLPDTVTPIVLKGDPGFDFFDP